MPLTLILMDGVGVGGSADMGMQLAKVALLRPVGERNTKKRIARIEEELLEAVNKTGIGPMGLGGKTTALDLHIDLITPEMTKKIKKLLYMYIPSNFRQILNLSRRYVIKKRKKNENNGNGARFWW